MGRAVTSSRHLAWAAPPGKFGHPSHTFAQFHLPPHLPPKAAPAKSRRPSHSFAQFNPLAPMAATTPHSKLQHPSHTFTQIAPAPHLLCQACETTWRITTHLAPFASICPSPSPSLKRKFGRQLYSKHPSNAFDRVPRGDQRRQRPPGELRRASHTFTKLSDVPLPTET